MKRTIRENFNPPYSLHDMYIMSFDITGDKIVMTTQSGMISTAPPYSQLDGYVEITGIRWEFSYVYLMDFTGNVGSFTGEKMFLKDYFSAYPSAGFTVMDENFGYNSTKLAGYTTINGRHYECMLEIYHEGDMVYSTGE